MRLVRALMIVTVLTWCHNKSSALGVIWAWVVYIVQQKPFWPLCPIIDAKTKDQIMKGLLEGLLQLILKTLDEAQLLQRKQFHCSIIQHWGSSHPCSWCLLDTYVYISFSPKINLCDNIYSKRTWKWCSGCYGHISLAISCGLSHTVQNQWFCLMERISEHATDHTFTSVSVLKETD